MKNKKSALYVHGTERIIKNEKMKSRLNVRYEETNGQICGQR